jgi:hypothetical protein
MDQDQAPDKQRDQQPGNAAGLPTAKKPYVKPAYEFERAFETMALSCGKITITQAQCKFNRKSS